MIRLTRFDKSEFYVNPHQIEFIESKPDTVITLLSGKMILVRETVDQIRTEILKYRKTIGNLTGGNEE